MTTKVWLLIALVVLFAGLSLYINRDWFARDHIHIYVRSRPTVNRAAKAATVNPVTFGIDRPIKLKAVRVVPVDDPTTNFWYLVSESNSVPVSEFTYGSRISGMHTAVKGARATPLEPGLKYRLYVETRNFKGEQEFTAVAAPASAAH
jgi:hypothetical protein